MQNQQFLAFAQRLAYRLVAGKLAIIFQFMILTSRKSQNPDFSRKSAMSDMQCWQTFYFPIILEPTFIDKAISEKEYNNICPIDIIEYIR
ncbi:hypothetical protein [Psychroflexus aestuariivivens]|uniref:hypothetical protein n=1 Tax=Psychroflexus aestuariivivens TaxID=1795040 RepID=UPI000FD90466|nr:hypothetical protein [Psychroflexus aestuariivivens]